MKILLIFFCEINEENDENYFKWKYLSQPYFERPNGFIAYKNDSPIGCIGI